MIKLGPLKLNEAEFASQGSAVLGIRDSGKTYTATPIAERMFDGKFQKDAIAFAVTELSKRLGLTK